MPYCKQLNCGKNNCLHPHVALNKVGPKGLRDEIKLSRRAASGDAIWIRNQAVLGGLGGSWEVLGASQGPLGDLLGGLGDLLGGLWGLLGTSWGIFGASWGILGGLWEPLGQSLGPLWDSLCNLWRHLGGLWGLLGAIWVPKSTQKASQSKPNE